MEEENNKIKTLKPKSSIKTNIDFMDFAKKNLLWVWRLNWILLTISTITLLLLIYLTIILTNFVWVIKTPAVPLP